MLNVCCFNVRGLRKRMVEVMEIMQREKIDALALVETFLRRDSTVPTSSRHESLMKVPRNSGRAAGGVTLLVRNGIKFK